VLARRSREQPDVSTYAGAIVLASGVMYVRLNVLVLLFAPALGVALAPRLLGLAVGAGAAGGSPSPSAAAPTIRSGREKRPSSVTLLLAAASNDLAKAGYALVFGDRRVGRDACLGLLVLAGLTAALAFR